MQYFGGKSRIAAPIAEVINSFTPTIYYEPFVGGLWVTQHIQARTYMLSDINPALITLYKYVWNGWTPPDQVTESDYEYYKILQDVNDPMTAFTGIGCSFSGKWFGGYARNARGDNYARAARNSLLKKFDSLRGKDVLFECSGFDYVYVENGSVMYSDPPYQNTTGNGYWSGVGDFWDTMRAWCSRGINMISEYNAPEDFTCIEEFSTFTEIRGVSGRNRRTERLFTRL